ncbi:MAG TPA: hypothetical protein VF599_23350 [Pyrinomonadaceae bacterium]|jgi:hypothetical protein
MANRAYLFATDIKDFQQIENDEEPYYDSRWNIPLLWFLFFDASSVKPKKIVFGNDAWQEVVLVENKETAIHRFLKLYPRLEEVFGKHFFDYTEFIKNINNWERENLVLNPTEIIEDHSKALQDFSAALEFIQSGKTENFVKILDEYAGVFSHINKADSRTLTIYFIGFTYW